MKAAIWTSAIAFAAMGGVLATTCLVFAPRPASACEPAPNHSVEIRADDSPDCVIISDAFSYQHGALNVDNRCEQDFVFEVEDCPGCGKAITVDAGEKGTMVIESRKQKSSATLAWSVGEMSGQIRATTDWSDKSDACDTRGCSVAGVGGPRGAVWAVGLLLLGGLARSSRRQGATHSGLRRCVGRLRAR